MSRKYTHLRQYEKEILEMKSKGCTRRQIAEKLVITDMPAWNLPLAEKIRECQKHSYNTYQLREWKRSPQSCNSTVTRAFNIHPKHILS